MTIDCHTATLSNGMRVVHQPSTSAVVYCGIAVSVGSRHEESGEEGLAHFCEHATFKGTQRRRAIQVMNCLESVGGELNAFTNKEDTVYYAAIQREHFGRAVDLLTDIVFHSTYPEAELVHERDVVCDEIESYNDTPSELIFDEFENLLFCGHPLGHNILGTAQSVSGFSTAETTRFTKRHYIPSRCVFFVAGDISFDRLLRRLETLCPVAAFGYGESLAAPCQESVAPVGGDAAVSAAQAQASNIRLDTHQSHVMMGHRGYAFSDERRMPLFLLNNLLGGPSMSNRLNVSLRERRGLVYTVESVTTSYSDTGCWAVYFGCDHHDVARCTRLVHRELQRLVDRPISERQLSAAKRQLKGQLAIGYENVEQRTIDMARTFLHYDRMRSLSDVCSEIDAVTAEQMHRVAQELFLPSALTTLIIE